jgi:hypothetical protein
MKTQYKFNSVSLETTLKAIWDSNKLSSYTTLNEKKKQELAVELSRYKFNAIFKCEIIKFIKEWLKPDFSLPVF